MNANRWRDTDFAALSFKHRACLMALECLADKAGVVEWDLDKIHEVLGDGVDFSRLDVKEMGADHVVWMDGGGQIMLSQFMKTQCCGTLSRKAPPHKPVWQAISKWWGVRNSKTEPELFLEFFASKSIFRHAPKIKGEDHSQEGDSIWKPRMLMELEEAGKVTVPDSLPASVYEAMAKIFAWRQRMALRCRLRTEAEKWTWTREQAELDIEQVQKMLKKFTTESVETQLNNMIRVTSPYLNPPPLWKCNLLPEYQKDANE